MNDAVLKNLNEALMLAQFRGADLGNRRYGVHTSLKVMHTSPETFI